MAYKKLNWLHWTSLVLFYYIIVSVVYILLPKSFGDIFLGIVIQFVVLIILALIFFKKFRDGFSSEAQKTFNEYNKPIELFKERKEKMKRLSDCIKQSKDACVTENYLCVHENEQYATFFCFNTKTFKKIPKHNIICNENCISSFFFRVIGFDSNNDIVFYFFIQQ